MNRVLLSQSGVAEFLALARQKSYNYDNTGSATAVRP